MHPGLEELKLSPFFPMEYCYHDSLHVLTYTGAFGALQSWVVVFDLQQQKGKG